MINNMQIGCMALGSWAAAQMQESRVSKSENLCYTFYKENETETFRQKQESFLSDGIRCEDSGGKDVRMP